MEKLKSCGLAVALCGSLAQLASGQVILTEFDVGINKLHYFTGPLTARFAQGSFTADLYDGGWVYQFCYGYGGFTSPVGVDPIYCPLGTTAYIVLGDLDGDGVQDSAGYYSILGPVPAVRVEPFRPDMVQLHDRPGTVPQLQNFIDASSRIYYNLQTPTSFRQYNVSEYHVTRNYAGAPDGSKAGTGSLTTMNEELPTGQYVFWFPGIKATENTIDYITRMGVVVSANVEAYGVQRYNKGFRYTSGTWLNQNYQLDPRVTHKFTWTGNSLDTVRSTDKLQLAVLRPDALDVMNPTAANFVYPVDNGEYYIQLSTPAVTSYTLPSAVFRVGEKRILSTRFQRVMGTTAFAYDTSVRDFRAKLNMVDSYPGYASLNFPQGTLATKTKDSFDYDGDGVSNLMEFAAEYPTYEQIYTAAISQEAIDLETQQIKGWATPPVPVVQDKTSANTVVARSYVDAEGYIVVDVPKRPLSGSALTPTFSIQVASSSATPRYKKITPGKEWVFVYNPDSFDPTLPSRDDPDPSDPPESQTFSLLVATTDPDTGRVTTAAQDVTVSLSRSYWRLRSVAPAADPTATPPNFLVTIAATALK